MSPIRRREFLAGGAAALAALVPTAGKAEAGERVGVAVMGVRGRGRGLARGFAALPDAEVLYLCDPDERLWGERSHEVAEAQGGRTPKAVADVRRALDDPKVDAVVIATPDHWHALGTVWACQAGKHVYVEKPASHDVWEGRKMVEAARKYDRVVQVGTQSRSAPHYLAVMDFLRSGKLGKVHMARAWNSQSRPDLPPREDSAAPAGVDYGLWLGPAPERPFNENRFHYSWHWHWDYGTGDMGNDGVHDLDIARWGLGAGLPSQVSCTGANFAHGGWETPDTLVVGFRFPETDAVLVYEQRDWSPYVQEGFENGVAFYGTEGYLIAGRKGWQVVRPKGEPEPVSQVPFSDEPHRRDFLDRIKAGGRPNADIEEGHRSSTLAHLGNIAYRVGRGLSYDGQAEAIVGDPEAAALLRRPYRPPFTVPEQV